LTTTTPHGALSDLLEHIIHDYVPTTLQLQVRSAINDHTHRAIQQAAGAVPEGCQIVSVKLSEPVRDVLIDRFDKVSRGACLLFTDVWADILAASPSSPVQPNSGHLGAGGSQDHLVPCAGGGVKVPLTDEKRRDIATNWFAEEWAIKKALGLIDDIEAAHGINPGSATREDGK